MFCCGVIDEKWIGGERCVFDGFMDEDDEATPASGARAVTANGGVVIEVIEFGGGLEFGFLKACDENRVGVEEGVYFVIGVLNAIAVELEYCAGGGGSRVGR